MPNPFAHTIPSSEANLRIGKLRRAFSELADLIRENSPACREQSVAMTHLETAAMWATKGVAHNDPNSIAEPL